MTAGRTMRDIWSTCQEICVLLSAVASSCECSFCLNSESQLHVVATCSCSSYLDRYTWSHDSILQFISNSLLSQHIQIIYADLPSFPNLSSIAGGDFRPDLLISTKENCLYALELTVGYETNLRKNRNRKRLKYEKLIMDQSKKFNSVKFINLFISALGVFDKESAIFLKMLKDMDVDKTVTKYLIRRIIHLAIRSTYYIFCCRNKEWIKPDLFKF